MKVCEQLKITHGRFQSFKLATCKFSSNPFKPTCSTLSIVVLWIAVRSWKVSDGQFIVFISVLRPLNILFSFIIYVGYNIFQNNYIYSKRQQQKATLQYNHFEFGSNQKEQYEERYSISILFLQYSLKYLIINICELYVTQSSVYTLDVNACIINYLPISCQLFSVRSF